ncbi:MAG: hypothetical protein ACI9XK_004781 [Granulosicoccus sp.]|jgi:hypothetical protein
MRKTDKKIDSAIVRALTEVCETAKENNDGFEWITHFSNYNNFPRSLSIVCIYDTNEQLKSADLNEICLLINRKLLSINVNLKDIRRHVDFDTEENCTSENDGNWNERFK